jgi:glycosyltransferase involved in cell wall biosynthesis
MKVLFIHHGNILGGAPLSLLYLVRELERQPDVNLEVVCHAPQMRDFFAKNLTSPVNLWVNPRTHFGKILIGWVYFNSLLSYKLFFRDVFNLPVSIWKQFRLISQRQPDIVHLNSAVLFSSAIAAWLAGFPIVWHIREPLQGGVYRQNIIGKSSDCN